MTAATLILLICLMQIYEGEKTQQVAQMTQQKFRSNQKHVRKCKHKLKVCSRF